jgi:hypothetical protein
LIINLSVKFFLLSHILRIFSVSPSVVSNEAIIIIIIILHDMQKLLKEQPLGPRTHDNEWSQTFFIYTTGPSCESYVRSAMRTVSEELDPHLEGIAFIVADHVIAIIALRFKILRQVSTFRG